MSAATSASAPQGAAQHELVITRTFDAPRALVFRAWTQPEHMVRWMGPFDYTCLGAKLDVRVGGAYRVGIRSAQGKEHWMRGNYREIVEPERLVFSFSWEEEGERGRENTVTITFADVGGKTRMTFRQAFFETVESRDDHNKGWNSCFDRLAQYVANER